VLEVPVLHPNQNLKLTPNLKVKVPVIQGLKEEPKDKDKALVKVKVEATQMQEQFQNQVPALNRMPNPLMERKIRKKVAVEVEVERVAPTPVHRAALTLKLILTVWLHLEYVAILMLSKILESEVNRRRELERVREQAANQSRPQVQVEELDRVFLLVTNKTKKMKQFMINRAKMP